MIELSQTKIMTSPQLNFKVCRKGIACYPEAYVLMDFMLVTSFQLNRYLVPLPCNNQGQHTVTTTSPSKL